ncbi:MAG TPA: hypothetical protein ENN68_04330 [Methanomicrobia archaeon]|nr:hypothetical protein [Methanomicrobia archaeon]
MNEPVREQKPRQGERRPRKRRGAQEEECYTSSIMGVALSQREGRTASNRVKADTRAITNVNDKVTK